MSGARVLRPRSTVTHRRNQWTHQATQRGDRDRYQRTQHARLSAERDRVTTARNAAQARLQPLAAPRRPLAAHLPRPVPRPTVDVGVLALQRFLVGRIGLRAVARVLRFLAWALGLKKAPGPPTVSHGGMRRAIVRLAAARGRTGVPLRPAPCPPGLLWRRDMRMGRGPGKIVAVLAGAAHHHQRPPGALALEQVHGLGGGVADAWTGATSADGLPRLIAQMGRPAASRKDGGSARHQATDVLGEHGVRRPCLDASAHAVAGMRKRADQAHPALTTFVSAWGQVSGTLQHPLLAGLAPPQVRTQARGLPVHRVVPWADRVRKRSPAGGAKTGSTCATWRVCLEQLPAGTARITRLRAAAAGRLAGQTRRTTTGRSHDTRAQGAPLMDTMPSSAWRQACRASLDCERKTATPLGREHLGVPIRSAAIASRLGMAKSRGVGEIQDAARIALRLPAFCGVPTREDAEHVLTGSGGNNTSAPLHAPPGPSRGARCSGTRSVSSVSAARKPSLMWRSYRVPKTGQMIKKSSI